MFVSKKTADSRYDICKKCEYLTSYKVCKMCKCIMPIKVKLLKATCPANKWSNPFNSSWK